MKKEELLYKKIHKMSNYELQNRFEYLGEGISRIVYGINEDWVVKIAKGLEGLYQNKVEIYVYKHSGPSFRKYLCPIIWHRPDMIIMPRAIPLSKLTILKKINLKSIRSEPGSYEEILSFTRRFYMLPEDIESASSWGLVNNIPVLIDYGCTDEKGDKFYDSI